MRRLIALLALASTATAAAAEESPICATRPGKSTAPCTVPAGHFQIETGLADWSLQKAGGDRSTSLAIAQTTFKYGLTDHSDIELQITPWEHATSRGANVHHTASRFGDLVVSYKHALTPDSPVQLTVLPYVKIPTAKQSIGNGKWEGGVLLPIGYSIPNTPLSINLTPELDWVADGDGRGHHAAMAQVASLGWAVTSKFSLSGDVWAQWDWDPAAATRQYSADASAAYLLSNDVQLDAGANFGLNRDTPDVELYAGISKRF